jgi:uncharacterized membrane protein YfcA
MAVLGGWLGHRFNARIQPVTARNTVHAVLLLSGISLLLRSIVLV